MRTALPTWGPAGRPAMSERSSALSGVMDSPSRDWDGAEMEPIRVLIVDDHEIFRTGLRTLLDAQPDIDVLEDVGSAREAIALATELQPDVVVMDINMPELSGVDATREIVKVSPHIGVLMLTMHEDDDSVFAALRAGARGYLLKSDSSKNIIDAVRLGGGPAVFGRGIAQRVIEYFSAPRVETTAHIFPELTDREREILTLIAEGESNPAIAKKLFLSPKTVRNHVSNIFSKLQVADRAQAIVRARRAGLTDN
jgi:DNA-binding NarL/FixJ family response regulator